ncbi:vacuolar membrane-associated protein iml1, partial [Coemansia spiralis]
MTQPIFRSESGRFIILLQMSEEMWAYHEDGNLCFEKAVNGFLAELFRRWNKSQLNHMVTIVMFSRWYYHGRDSLFYQDLTYDEETGRYYRDFYKVISDMEARPDWTVFLPELLAEFNAYRRDIQELTTASGNRLRGDLSKANQGNILEAINLGLNSFASNYVDRDLSRTGLSTVVVTPSFGVFDVPKRLLRMTTERMLHFGVRVDLVCLAPRPLFRPPVFRFKSYPVPSEQEQLRAQTLKEQAEQDAKRASESKLSSSSPLAESPGIHPVAGPFGPGGGGTALKDRTAKAAPKAAGLCSAIDPIMLDALYFDDEKWETELLPYLTGVTPRASHDSWVGKWHAAGVGGARANSAELEAVRQRQRQVESSIASAFVGSMANFSPAEVPDTILGLLKADHPYFAEVQPATDSKNRVVCCYFAYWVDSGFYNFADDRRSRHPGSFVPTCKMGDLSVAGIDNYMRCAPNIPALELRARDFGHAAGGDTYTGSASACSIGDPIYNRVEAGWPQDAQIAAAATNVAHGMILRTDQLASIEGHESLLAMFAAFDSQAIVGSGADHFVGSSGIEAMGSGSMWAGSGPLGAAGEHRTTYGHIPTPQHLVQTMAAANAPAVNRAPEPRSAATERGDTGPSRSAERPDRQLPGVSASASPKLRSSQDGKPGPPPERREPMSSSLPRDTRLAGSHQPSAAVQRTPGVSRASQLPPARRARLSRHPSSSAKPSVSPDPSHLAAAEQPSAVSGPSPTHDLPLGRAGGGSTPEAATRQSIPRRSESPHGLEYSRDSLGAAHHRPVGESMATQVPLSERMPVSESITRQSHLDIQVRTFRGHGGHDFPAIQNVQSPNAVSMATQMALAMPRHYAPDASVGAIRPVGNFQLTLPDGRHGAAAPEHASGSPQFGKPTWLNDRLTASHGSEPPVRAPRGRYYGPFNPYNPDISQLPHNELSQRWALAFATHASLSSYTPKWRSLCTPASLPLVVNFIPHDLDSSYHHYQYQLQTSAATALEEVASQLPEDFGEFAQFMANHGWDSTGVARAMPAQQPDRMTHLMLRELVYQRLAQGYQLINVNEQVDARSSREMSVRFGDGAGRPGLGGRPETRAGPGGRSVMDPHLSSVSSFSGKLPLGSLKKRENAIWLSSGRQVQKLEIQDRSEAASSTEISVTRWERNRPFDMASLDYRFQMWSRIGNLGYSPSDTRFSYPGDDEVNWNSLDRLITGHHQELNHAMKYWRARYVLIPAEQLGNEVIFNAKTSPHLPV